MDERAGAVRPEGVSARVDEAGANLVRPAGHALEDHTADVAVRSWGPSAADVFAQAALAMMSLMYDVGVVEPREHREIELAAPDGELLLAAWLNELLYLLEAEAFLGHEFRIDHLDVAPPAAGADCSLRAIVAGETDSEGRHAVRDVVKAATLHDLFLRPCEGGWEGHVLLDI